MVFVLVSYGNIERINVVGKKGETFDDVVTMLLDYCEDLRRQDWVNTKSDEHQYKERIRGKTVNAQPCESFRHCCET
jgi:hypothetical protein